MRLGIVTPLNARETGVADYVFDLLPFLVGAAGEPVWLFSKDDSEGRALPNGCVLYAAEELPKLYSKVDLLIYQMGNSPAHDFMAPFLPDYPGLLVLHDVSLYHFFTRQFFNSPLYTRVFRFAFGATCLANAGLTANREPSYPDFLLNEWLITRSPGVIVHSSHAATIVKERCPTARVWVVPMPISSPEQLDRRKSRILLGLSPDAYMIVVFGVLNESKNPVAILNALEHLINKGIPAQAIFIGVENSEFRLKPVVEQRGLQDCVLHPGFVEDLATVNLWLSAADIGIGLRTLYWGETPSSLLRMMAAGLPTIVNDIGAFSELPDSACVKIPPGGEEVAERLFLELERLYYDTNLRYAMGISARQYIGEVHDPVQVAHLYLEAAWTIVTG